MAVRLSAWLADTFEWQLILGNHWLQERHEKKKSGVKTEGDRAWEGLYHDNGSCLEIIDDIHPERNSALQVLQAQPWTLTDGRHLVVAHLTPDCARHFAARYPAVSYLNPGSTIAVRKYTIQYTSYGPPAHRLRFLLHHIEWVGLSCPGARDLNTTHLVPISQHGAIGAVQEQLRETRARQDRHCLSVSDTQENDTMAGDPHSGSQSTSQNFHSQAPFATQFQHRNRVRSDSDEPQIIAERSWEPVLAGNTQREEIRPEQSATRYEKEQYLLKLLGKQSETTAHASSSQVSVRTALAGPRSRAAPAGPSLGNSRGQTTARPLNWTQSCFARRKSTDEVTEPFLEEPLESSNHGALRSGQERQNTEDEPSLPNSREESGRDASSRVSGDREAADSAQSQDDIVARNTPEDTSASPECSWMKGFIFNSETLKVSKLQQQCLTKDSSWLHPPPGCPPFQDGNMPQSILAVFHRIADERASAEDDGNSDESNIDPSPDSFPVTINLSAESAPQTTQDDDEEEEGMVSQWSPSPEPPPRPLKPHQDLPPDSSPVTQNQPVPSPLAVEILTISDDEMEMEESIPQGLGEDFTQNAGSHADIPAVSSPKPNPPQSVVQVRETPYKNGKTAQHTDNIPFRRTIPKQTQGSSGESADTSSTSVVHSTYSVPRALGSVGATQASNEETDSTRKADERASQERRELQGETAATEALHASEHVQIAGDLLKAEDTASPSGVEQEPQVSDNPSGKRASAMQSNTTSESLQSHGPATGSTKRKLQASPAKDNRRHSKRREIKIVGFGDITPPSADPVAKLREEREESLRRFREQGNSSTNIEKPRQPLRASTDKQVMDAMDLDSADMPDNELQLDRRSPRHESLYDEPSPRPVRFTELVQSRPLHRDLQLGDQPRFSQAKRYGTSDLQTQYTSAVSDGESCATVFAMFKATYPEYKGDTNHFHNHCKQIYKLDQEDKMVPKWQWDDFIIRNRTDYRDYAMACLDNGEDPEPYLRFYKNNIRDTLYRRGVIEGRETLEQALEEVGVVIEDLDAPADPPSRPSSSRKSLPSSFEQMRKPRHNFGTVSHARPRQSLPASSYAQQQYYQGTPSPPRHQNPRERIRPPRPSQPEPTGDPFRDYYFSIQRSTSYTGSKKVDRSKPWPRSLECRPSIEDIPRPKVDVLQWGDVLGKGRLG